MTTRGSEIASAILQAATRWSLFIDRLLKQVNQPEASSDATQDALIACESGGLGPCCAEGVQVAAKNQKPVVPLVFQERRQVRK